MAAPDYDVIKDIPGYKVILKAVIKSQIQQLVEQLASTTDEESVILTASVADGTLSHLGSVSGKGFLEDHEDIKSQFLGFCLKSHQKRKEAEKERRAAELFQQCMQTSPGKYGGTPGPYTAVSARFPSHRGRGSVHPVGIHKASPGSLIRSPGVRHEPYTVSHSPRRAPLNFDSGRNLASGPGSSPVRVDNKLDGQVIKIEPGSDNEASNQSENGAINHSKLESLNQSQSGEISVQSDSRSQSGEKDDDAQLESANTTIPNESLAEGLSLDSDLSNVISGPSYIQGGESGEMDPNVSVKIEALTESEMELEITGVEPGRPVVPQDNWDPNVSMGMNFDPSQGAVGNQDVVTAQGYNIDLSGALNSVLAIDQSESTYYNEEGKLTDAQALQNFPEFYSTCKFDGSVVHVCKVKDCRKAFKCRRAMMRHIRTHTKEKPFSCRYCNYRCSRKDNLKVHELKHSLVP
ncbi:uncharacterized protein LOC123541529 isoform X2 [Mercenaria mercenaria]|uniref:uncharacterized protein LOC123541529 isoform X2 n=1 Tax=Mercenaria mercenaria TaxID=6596 RepID=UPI00234F063A|nr:uncharacterized protein LOC123541529 isoform X2 [Mercenaria mercenaria]